uniref:Class I SAM-dependent methyltransferase n=1 Tax=Ignisphaera aggregans TaxID=334771 RepID=A0A7J3Z578_9CREN
MSVAPRIPSPKIVVEYLKYALGVGKEDVVLDLGCGDGRVLLEFAKIGATTICIEIDRVLCNIVEVAFNILGLGDKARIICKDFFQSKLIRN